MITAHTPARFSGRTTADNDEAGYSHGKRRDTSYDK